MGETAHYHLYLTESDQEEFVDWRNRMNGPFKSNMQKIDDALYGKADQSESIDATLVSSAWAGETAPFVQEVSVPGLTVIRNGTVSVTGTASHEERTAARNALLSIAGQADGTLTIAADGEEKPGINIPITIILLG